MEMDENFYKSICRVCLSHDNSDMVSLFEKSSEENGLSYYGRAVISVAKLSLKTEYLPSFMCQKCLNSLKQAIIFKQKCEKSDLELIKLVTKSGFTEAKIKENVSQFVLFNYYFPDGCDDSDNEPEVITKPEPHNEENNFDIQDDSSNDNFGDLFEYVKEQKEHSENEENVDLLLDNIEKVIQMSPHSLSKYKKQYKQKRPTNELISVKRMKKSAIRAFKRQAVQSHPVRDIKCKICSKVLANIATYRCHMQSHYGFRYVCEHCAKGFAINAQLQYHQAAVHNIGRMYICKQCGHKAARKCDLTEHERKHTGERPYSCDKCGLTFRRRFVWKKHAIYHTEKTVKCPQCPRMFYRKVEMLSHANNVHERVYVYACNVCEVTYAKSSTLRRHLMEKHGISREMQGKVRRVNIGKSTSNFK